MANWSLASDAPLVLPRPLPWRPEKLNSKQKIKKINIPRYFIDITKYLLTQGHSSEASYQGLGASMLVRIAVNETNNLANRVRFGDIDCK